MGSWKAHEKGNGIFRCLKELRVAGAGFEPGTGNPEKPLSPPTGGAESSAFAASLSQSDAMLQRIVQLWPLFSEENQKAILAIVEDFER